MGQRVRGRDRLQGAACSQPRVQFHSVNTASPGSAWARACLPEMCLLHIPQVRFLKLGSCWTNWAYIPFPLLFSRGKRKQKNSCPEWALALVLHMSPVLGVCSLLPVSPGGAGSDLQMSKWGTERLRLVQDHPDASWGEVWLQAVCA